MTRTERTRRFVALQRGMLDVWAAGTGREGASVVVVPSRGVDKWQETPAETRAYEERLLCLLLLLRQPGLHVVYVTSEPVAPAIVDYYLSLLPDVVPDDARARLTLLSADDASPRPLSEKLLDRPLLVHRIRRAIPNRDLAHLIPYCPTSADCDLR